MDYITLEQFESQPKIVQETFLNWWKPSIGDKMYSIGISSGEYILLDYYNTSGYEVIDLKSGLKSLVAKNVFIPLLTETQLRHFIEEKTGKIDCIGITGHDYSISTFTESYGVEYADDLLQAYWQVACKIAA